MIPSFVTLVGICSTLCLLWSACQMIWHIGHGILFSFWSQQNHEYQEYVCFVLDILNVKCLFFFNILQYFFIIYFTYKLFFKGDCGGKESGGEIMLWRRRWLWDDDGDKIIIVCRGGGYEMMVVIMEEMVVVVMRWR
jgi:hypothetical protein